MNSCRLTRCQRSPAEVEWMAAKPTLLESPDMTCGNDQCNSNSTVPLASRQGIITVLTSAAVLLPASHLVAATDVSADDERFMRIALDEARQGDSPFGAVIVHDG